ncbi:MAG: hypothetical protein H7Y00_03620 [Fimbriimonadaceae bacterium]|nr:hypothetical protein [Chitinophagales bacterium]
MHTYHESLHRKGKKLFTKQENAILNLAITGISSKQIAAHMQLNIQTINSHKGRMRKN